MCTTLSLIHISAAASGQGGVQGFGQGAHIAVCLRDAVAGALFGGGQGGAETGGGFGQAHRQPVQAVRVKAGHCADGILTGVCQLGKCIKQLRTYAKVCKLERLSLIHIFLGSLDRFMAYLIEETKGKFPTWMAPTQVKVLPVSEKTLDYAEGVTEKLVEAGVRVVLDDDNQKIGYKIREAQQVDRVPYMLVLGAKEAEAGNISVRDRKCETTTMELDAFIAKVTAEIRNRSL